jgi:hypothetical protein
MSEMILPGVYINVHPEGLIAPGQITIANLGVVGTAAKGDVDLPVLLNSFDDAKKHFYEYDSWVDSVSNKPNAQALTLVRALEQAFAFGATVVYAVRVSHKDGSGNPTTKSASLILKAQGNESVQLTANQPGTWGNHLSVDIQTIQPKQAPFIQEEVVPISGPEAFKLKRSIDKTSARNRVTLENQGVVTPLNIVYDKPPVAGKNQVAIVTATGKLQFVAPEVPKGSVILTASYTTTGSAQQVTIHLDKASETYIVADGTDLVSQVVNGSNWVTGPANTASVKPLLEIPSASPAPFTGGADGIDGAADYQSGLDALLNVEAHIIVGAGQDQSFGPALERHCAVASTDALKRDRIAIVGSGLIDNSIALPDPNNPNSGKFDTFFDKLIGHNLLSDRLVFVAPGIQAMDTASGEEVTLPGAYAAAAVAGLISSFDPEVSPTNKGLSVDELEVHMDAAHLTLMVQNRILALERRTGFRIVKGITTDDGAFTQITTRRIVDYAKYGVRAAAEPYIGLLNNDRVRGALRGTINSFLTDMVNAEMLESYDLDVSATRDEEIQGIARVTMSLQPVFSIDFIVVDMFLG